MVIRVYFCMDRDLPLYKGGKLTIKYQDISGKENA